MYFLVFFFSSRRRHTRYIGDWSSDVCSSDLRSRRLQPFCRRRERVGQPLDDGAVVETDPSFEGQAYVRLDLPALHLDAVRLERALDVVECLGLARAAGLALPRADRAHVLTRRLRLHRSTQRRLQRTAAI